MQSVQGLTRHAGTQGVSSRLGTTPSHREPLRWTDQENSVRSRMCSASPGATIQHEPARDRGGHLSAVAGTAARTTAAGSRRSPGCRRHTTSAGVGCKPPSRRAVRGKVQQAVQKTEGAACLGGGLSACPLEPERPGWGRRGEAAAACQLRVTPPARILRQAGKPRPGPGSRWHRCLCRRRSHTRRPRPAGRVALRDRHPRRLLLLGRRPRDAQGQALTTRHRAGLRTRARGNN